RGRGRLRRAGNSGRPQRLAARGVARADGAVLVADQSLRGADDRVWTRSPRAAVACGKAEDRGGANCAEDPVRARVVGGSMDSQKEKRGEGAPSPTVLLPTVPSQLNRS